jgi:hypothetical protein
MQSASAALRGMARDEIREPGTYVDVLTGTLHRVPARALAEGALPVCWKDLPSGARLVQLSKNPYLISLEARILCAAHQIHFNF